MTNQEFVAYFEEQVLRSVSNLDRALRLVKLYKDLYGQGKGRRAVHKGDLLRAAVVLTHASLEDYLRTLSSTFLPFADEETLNQIPLYGLQKGRNPKQFLLGKLSMHRGKTIDEVIQDSVEAYLQRTTYNNTTEIASLLRALELDVSQVEAYFSELDKLMSRRHQIVHRADRNETPGRGKQRARSINAKQVENWIWTTNEFFGQILSQVVFRKILGEEA